MKVFKKLFCVLCVILLGFTLESKILEKKYTTDLVIFSYDRPLQLQAYLESIDKYITNLNQTFVLYRASNDDFDQAYQTLKKDFSHVRFFRQDEDNPYVDFKPLFLYLTFEESKSTHILFGVDDIIVTDYIDLDECVTILEQTPDAYGFYLRLGKNITQCYTLSITNDFPLPDLKEIESRIYSWEFNGAPYDWEFWSSVDMTVFKKEDIRNCFYELNYGSPNGLERIWATWACPKKFGLCYEHSKIVNIPLNIVHENKKDRNMSFLTTEELLEEFTMGFKIDIEPLCRFNNKAPHMHYIPELI